MIAYGDNLPEGKVSTLLGGMSMQFFLGNYGEDKVVLIDPGAERPYRLIELPVRRIDFALDPANPRNAYILTEDGKLHLLDVVSGKITTSATITEPYSKDGHWRDPRPRLAVAGDQIAITDPRHSLLRVVDSQTQSARSRSKASSSPSSPRVDRARRIDGSRSAGPRSGAPRHNSFHVQLTNHQDGLTQKPIP